MKVFSGALGSIVYFIMKVICKKFIERIMKFGVETVFIFVLS